MSSLHVENAVLDRHQSDDCRLVHGTAIPDAKSKQRAVAHSREFTHGVSIPSDQHYSKLFTGQKSAAVSRTGIGNVSHVDDRSLHTVAPIVNVAKSIETNRSVTKNGARMVACGAVPAPKISPEEAQRQLLACENVRLFEAYATLPRRSCHQKADYPDQWQKSAEIPQQRLRLSGACYDVSKSVHVQKDRTSSSPLCDSLPRLKISW